MKSFGIEVFVNIHLAHHSRLRYLDGYDVCASTISLRDIHFNKVTHIEEVRWNWEFESSILICSSNSIAMLFR